MTAEESFLELLDGMIEQIQQAKSNVNAPDKAYENLMMVKIDIKDAMWKATYLIKRGAKV